MLYSRNTLALDLVHEFSGQVKGRSFLLTGPSPGSIGAECVVSLAAEAPAMLILLGRSKVKIQPTIDAVKAVDAKIEIRTVEVELSSLDSVRAAAKTILYDDSITKIDVVINNAGIMACPKKLTRDGIESQFAINHLSHFLLTNLIMPKIQHPGGRLINVTSSAHRYQGVRFLDPNFSAPDSYSEFGAYGQAKSANILFSVALNQRLAARGVRAFAPTPGSVHTGLQDHVKALGDRAQALYEEAAWKVSGMSMDKLRQLEPVSTWPEGHYVKTLQQGSATIIRAALDPNLVYQEGIYVEDANLAISDIRPVIYKKKSFVLKARASQEKLEENN
ncbi:NAD(P)-binding protein [Xylariaceae sp. FL1272]|nr:NAD(P)-binding protein [Xylariaceae sp. FL1272]